MRNLNDIEKVKWFSFLVKLEGELRKPENEVFSIINGQVRRVK
jgi:hypothetical protein